MRKGNIVTEILDGITSHFELVGYAVFEDSWINKYDLILYDEHDHEYPVLDCKFIEKPVYSFLSNVPRGLLALNINPWKMRKFSAVKFAHEVKVGDIFYTSKNVKSNEQLTLW